MEKIEHCFSMVSLFWLDHGFLAHLVFQKDIGTHFFNVGLIYLTFGVLPHFGVSKGKNVWMLHLLGLVCSILGFFFWRNNIWKTIFSTTLKQNNFLGNQLLFGQFVCQNLPYPFSWHSACIPFCLMARFCPQQKLCQSNWNPQISPLVTEYPAKNSKVSPWNKNHREKKQKSFFSTWYGPVLPLIPLRPDTPLIRLWNGSDTPPFCPWYVYFFLVFGYFIFFGELVRWKKWKH